MVIGVLKISMELHGVFSLKEKRHIVKSLLERIRSRFNVSAAETDLNEKWGNAVIGIACVTNESAHADSIMANIVNFIETDGRVFISNYVTELINV